MNDLSQYIRDTYKYRWFREDDREARDLAQGLIGEFLESCHATSLLKGEVEKTNLTYEDDVIIEIVERVRMRKLYFYVYHDLSSPDDLNELKEASLYAFWILKLHPFRWREGYYTLQINPLDNYALNARVALGLFIRGLKLYAAGKTAEAARTAQKDTYIVSLAKSNSEIVSTLYYSFRYRDWSKEALMDLAESMIIKKGSTPDLV